MATALWLLGYFTLNLTLTLYNKLVLTHFPFPYTLTALHALCGSVGSFLLTPVPQLNGTKERIVLLLFSTLYTLNIVVSNASLRLVTLPFHQCVRASAPAFVLLIQSTPSLRLPRSGSRWRYNPPSKRKLLTLVPVILGVALATYGDYYFTKSGFALTLLGTFLAALKTVITNVLVRASPQRALSSADEPYGTDSGKHAHYASNDTKSRLYSPLSPTAPFRSPSSPMITIAHRSSDSSGSSDCPDTLPRNRTFKPRPLSLSAFNPEGAIDDKAPSIPTPISSSLPSAQRGRYFTHSTRDAMAISEQQGLGPSTPQSAPPSPHVLHTTFPTSHSYNGSGNASGGTTATTNRTVSVRALRGPQSCSHNVNTIDLEKKVDTKHPYPHSHPRRFGRWLPLPLFKHPKFTEMWEYIHTLPTLHLTPLQLLSLLSPLAFVQCVALAWVSGELDDVNVHLHRRVSHSSHNSFLASGYSWSWVHSSVPLGFGLGFGWLGRFGSIVGLESLGVDLGWLARGQTPWLIANAVLAFALNVVSFGANKRVGAVGMSVAANTKQALTLLLSITLFNLTLAPLNLVGIVCALLGGAAYAWVEVMEGRVGRGGVV